MDEFHHQWHGQIEVVADFEKSAAYLPHPSKSAREHPLHVAVGLRVRNMSDAPLAMSFATAQSFEIELVDDKGHVVTRWSQGRAFAQTMTERTLEPHRSWYLEGELPLYDVDGRWAPSGNYTIRISISSNMHIGAQAPFRLLLGEP